jgi:hypothetical protein
MSETVNYTEHKVLVEKITTAGFVDGWILNDTELVLWEHDENPPKPLTRPKA